MSRQSIRLSFVLASSLLLAGCAFPDAPEPTAETQDPLTAVANLPVTSVTRTRLDGDVYHYAYTLQVGKTPNAHLQIHRVVREIAPWCPRPTTHAALLMHGDFGTFATNFAPTLGNPPSTAPGMAAYLAHRDIDVWGLDRRWTQAPTSGADLSDFADMGFDQELSDIDKALAFARTTRLATGSGADRVALVGFSRGGHLAYAYAATEAKKPAWQRHVSALVPIDVYAVIAPEDEAMRQNACARRDAERDALAAGLVDADNSLLVGVGQLARRAPDDASPFFPGTTNRGAFLAAVGQTYLFFQNTPLYHLNAPALSPTGQITGLRESSESAASAWLAGGAPHQSMRESAEGDALWCGEGSLPIDVSLGAIKVPLFYLGAAGGFGAHGLYTTTRVGSTDVTTHVVRRFGADREAEDFGHGDLLFSADAPTLAWKPLSDWLRHH